MKAKKFLCLFLRVSFLFGPNYRVLGGQVLILVFLVKYCANPLNISYHHMGLHIAYDKYEAFFHQSIDILVMDDM